MSIIDLKDTVIEVSAQGDFELSETYFIGEPARRAKGRTQVTAYLIKADYDHPMIEVGRPLELDLTSLDWRFISQPIEEENQVKPAVAKPIGLVTVCETCRCMVDDEQKHNDWHLNLRTS